MLEASIDAFFHLFSPGPLLAMLLVLPVALFSGLMPGGGLPVSVVVLSLAVHLDPWVAITIVVFHMAASDITEPIPAILFGVPGARSAQATVLDGYPMAQKGLAGVALGASYTTTIVGGIIGAIALLLALPVSRQLLEWFGSAEFFLLTLMGVLAVAVVSAGAFVKGILTAAFGIAIAMVGYADLGGNVRAAMGFDFYLWDGFTLVPVVVGLFALPEAIALVVGDTTIARERLDTLLREAKSDVWRGMREAWSHKWLMARSSLIGVFVGIMPGVGGSAAHWIAYAQARQTEQGGTETFGKGDVRGVIASDAANNSVDGGVLIPTVVFGIPGSGGMAIVLAILILTGITPGPLMLTRHLDLTVSMVYTIAFANLVVVPIMLYFAPTLCRISVVPPNILAPVVVGIVSLAALAAAGNLGDLGAVLAFGLLGVFMKRYGWPRPPILIAVALADILERFLWISVSNYGWGMLLRPQFLAILAFMVAVTLFSLRAQRGAARAMMSMTEGEESGRAAAEGGAPAAGDDTAGARESLDDAATGDAVAESPTAAEKDGESPPQRRFTLEVAGEVVLLLAVGAFFLYMFIDSFSYPEGADLMPRLAVLVGTPFWLIRVWTLLRGTPEKRIEEGDIMDTGFILGDDPKTEGRRFVRIFGFTALMYAAIWFIGVHVALPGMLFLYLMYYGKAGWLGSAGVALAFLALIVGFYDFSLHIVWPESVFPLWPTG
ncbi:MAG: tripartite tricarboxylate transporter permease [Deltaproteobacteria bacterium]|nr:tripartite tricarboxylate transporter permease [Deltaproteobacteria bacterium]